jgi:hypothetical protein
VSLPRDAGQPALDPGFGFVEKVFSGQNSAIDRCRDEVD